MIIHGDCLERLKELEENSVDAVVTDPPYGWRFMGKAWDGEDIVKVAKAKEKGGMMADGKIRKPRDLPAESAGTYDQSLAGNEAFCNWTELYARELLRVLKPGGHALIFCGPRTYHAMAFGVERAGFEIRDQLQWIFGSGFPKSHNIDKAIDKLLGAKREVIATKDVGPDMRGGNFENADGRMIGEITKPKTPEAYRYKGWGTALKPANEPIVLARKPLEKGLTVAENMLKWGVGGLNIDESRIGSNPGYKYPNGPGGNSFSVGEGNDGTRTEPVESTQGRWPANLLLDERAAQMLDEQSGNCKSTGGSQIKRQQKENAQGWCIADKRGEINAPDTGFGDTGGASRFFYVAKASKRERGQGNSHPTVKPIRLMEYLCKLITPPGGLILDPFCGSGSTGVAAFKNGFQFIGIEMNEEYCEIARRRIDSSRGA